MRSLFLIAFVTNVIANMDCTPHTVPSASGHTSVYEYALPEKYKIVENGYVTAFRKNIANNIANSTEDKKLAKMFAKQYLPPFMQRNKKIQQYMDHSHFCLSNTGWSLTKCMIFFLYSGLDHVATELRASFRPPCNDEKETKQRENERSKYSLMAVGMEYYFQHQPPPSDGIIKEVMTQTYYHGMDDVCFDLMKLMYAEKTWTVNGALSTTVEKTVATQFAKTPHYGVILELKIVHDFDGANYKLPKGVYYPIDMQYTTKHHSEQEWLFWNGKFEIVAIHRTNEYSAKKPLATFKKSDSNDYIKMFEKIEQDYKATIINPAQQKKKEKKVTMIDGLVHFAKCQGIPENEVKQWKTYIDTEEFDSDALLDEIELKMPKKPAKKKCNIKKFKNVVAGVQWRFGTLNCMRMCTLWDATLVQIYDAIHVNSPHIKLPAAKYAEYADKYDYDSETMNGYYYENAEVQVFVDLILYLVVGIVFCCISFLCGAAIGNMFAVFVENVQKNQIIM